MNIKITYNWLLEYLDTDADPYEIGKYLSLCGPSVEHIDKIEDDYVFDIEVTSNRIDMASVFGIAQEAQAILPQFGKKAILRFNPLEKYTFENLNVEPVSSTKIDVTIEDESLCPRFTAMVFTDVEIKPSPELIQKRLRLVDIKSINNVIDISNYLMVSLGQPTHMFDYGQIQDGKIIMRKSKKGEKLITLDEKEFELPGDDIVIEDGSGKLVDFCGIMGGLNSSITDKTTKVLFFVQTYDKRKIRRSSMITGQRTMAATYFEKGLDTERVESTFVYGVDLIREMTGGIAHSELKDIYPHKPQETALTISLSTIQRVIGVTIDENRVEDILKRLGFEIQKHTAENHEVNFHVKVPSYRLDDVIIKEDIVEEVARVYGYHNLPNTISPLVYLSQPSEIEKFFSIQSKVKYLLKHIGLSEVMNYSMISGELIDSMNLNKGDHLKLANTISSDIEYMRLSLMPSLVKNMKDNLGRREVLKFFEIAKIYPPVTGELPQEHYKLGIAVDTNFDDLKGIIELLLKELHIHSVQFKNGTHTLLNKQAQAELVGNDNKVIGCMGKLKGTLKEKMSITKDLYLAEIDFDYLIENFKTVDTYKSPLQYAVIKLDANVLQKENRTFEDIKKSAFKVSSLLHNFEFAGLYQGKMNLRFYFSSPVRNITEEEAKVELNTILEQIK